MSLRSLLFLAMAAPAAAYEWYAVFKLEHGTEYKINLGQTASGGTAYADPAMKLYFAEVGATLDAVALDTLVDGAEAYMGTYCGTDAAEGSIIEMDTEKKCANLVMNTTAATSHWELHFEEHAHRRRLSGDDEVYFAIFAGHGIDEWEDSSTHFLKCGAGAACGDAAAGADIELECVGDVDHAGHDHGRRLSGDHEEAAPTCAKPSLSDGASKPFAAAALALAGLAGGLALFL